MLDEAALVGNLGRLAGGCDLRSPVDGTCDVCALSLRVTKLAEAVDGVRVAVQDDGKAGGVAVAGDVALRGERDAVDVVTYLLREVVRPTTTGWPRSTTPGTPSPS